MLWSSFLTKVVNRFVDGLGPVTGAAAETLLGEFLQAQDTELQRLEALNRELQGTLLRVEAGIGTLLTAPAQQARLHIEQAHAGPDDWEKRTEACANCTLRGLVAG